jgi:hypothetical protein
MATARFLSVLIKPDSSHTKDELKAAMDQALDWFRLTDTYYVAYSTASLDQWKSRLGHLVKPGGFMLIAPLDLSDPKGYVTKAFWEWLEKIPEKHSKKA